MIYYIDSAYPQAFACNTPSRAIFKSSDRTTWPRQHCSYYDSDLLTYLTYLGRYIVPAQPNQLSDLTETRRFGGILRAVSATILVIDYP